MRVVAKKMIIWAAPETSCMKKAFVLLAVLLTLSILAQAQKPSAAKEPRWVNLSKPDYFNTSLDKEAEDGYVDMDYEKQVYLAEQAVYYRFAQRIISEAGVQNKSQISIGFDPTYQQLIFHTINIIRNGQVINKLDLSKIKTVHQEADLQDFIYNGTVNALLVLDDVRKGDVIDYSYTLKGFNPVFENKYSTVITTAYSSPLYNLYFSISVPAGRTINVKAYNDTVKPAVQTLAGQTLYVWRKSLLQPVHTQDHLQGWYNPYPEIRISEYNNWKEVSDWAATLFPKNPALPQGLQQKIKEIQAANATDEGKALAALRFVQDDIRYMGIEMGIHSHKPVEPGKIFTQRFGDCKEKTYLLCTMLQAMGMEAKPVLINTEDKRALFSYLPAVQNFNHATVRAKINGTLHWFDPTISWQRGTLNNISYPDYQAGLVITDTTTALAAIPSEKNAMVDVKEVINIKDMAGNATLSVTTKYTGSYADAERDAFKNNSNYSILQGLQKFYAYYFEKISGDSITYYDNDSTGIFTRQAFFTIKDIWLNEKGIKKSEYSPFVIGSNMEKPDDKIRSMPYKIGYPAKYHEEVLINLPEDWDIDTSEVNASCPAFTFNMKSSYLYRQVRLVYNYEALKDCVQPGEADEYIAMVKKAEDGDGFELSYGIGAEKSTVKTSSGGILYVLIAITALVGGIVWWTQRR